VHEWKHACAILKSDFPEEWSDITDVLKRFRSNARRAIIQERIEGGPDLVIEVLSPGDTRKEMEKKLTDYARIGVRECWFVSIEAETVEVLQLSIKGVKRLGLYGPGDLVRSAVLPGLALPIKKLFAE
jgi:Uma2 family endonuclease